MRHRLIRNASIDGRVVDVALEGERIAAIGPQLAGEELIDARGGAVLPGLHDHHLHLLATAALSRSVVLDRCAGPSEIAQALQNAAAAAPAGEWLRATGYHERIAGALDRMTLDSLVPNRPLRIQHQTGSLWMVNSAGLAQLAGGEWPAGAERDASGELTGRFFRADAWLSERIGRRPPDLAHLGHRLATFGVTGVTDASASNDAASLALLAEAVRDRRLPVRLMAMAAGPIAAPYDGAFAVGPVKILLDDDRLPSLEDLTATIAQARSWKRTIAAHCVTAGELAMMIAALEEAGSRRGDRIEHGSVIPAEALDSIAALRLTVVTQPGFIATRGERYRALVDPAEQPDLYRCASLMAHGIAVAGSSDAPYGDLDPWLGMKAAITRRTEAGLALGESERIAARQALDLFMTPLEHPAGRPRTVAIGEPADICVLLAPIDEVLRTPSAAAVAATICAGELTYRS